MQAYLLNEVVLFLMALLTKVGKAKVDTNARTGISIENESDRHSRTKLL